MLKYIMLHLNSVEQIRAIFGFLFISVSNLQAPGGKLCAFMYDGNRKNNSSQTDSKKQIAKKNMS